LENFARRHGQVRLTVDDQTLRVDADDGATARLSPPLGLEYAGAAALDPFLAAVEECCAGTEWGVLLVRKGGFAVARLRGADVLASKVGRRHVQGRTKAGGQSQQRFARRRDNQARAAYAAAADHAARLLLGAGTGDRVDGDRPRVAVRAVERLVCGGDRAAVDAVLADRRHPGLATISELRVARWLAVPDPRRDVLHDAVEEALAVAVELHEPGSAARD
jgi:hypothetical protein